MRTENSAIVEAFGLLYGCCGKTCMYVLGEFLRKLMWTV